MFFKYLKKKLKNWKIEKAKRKRREVFNFIRDSKNSVNDKWIKLISNKKWLGDAEYEKWNHCLQNYEEIKGVK